MLSPRRLFGIAKLMETHVMVAGERLYRLAGRHHHDRNSCSHTLCRDTPHRRTRWYENEDFTHCIQDNGGRCCMREPMVQPDAEWLANNMNSATESETLFGRSSGLRVLHPRSGVLAARCLAGAPGGPALRTRRRSRG